MRQEIVRRQNIRDHRAGLRKGQIVAASPLAFALDEGVRERGQHDVSMPAVEGPPFEVVEPEFVFELGVLLLAGPAVMRQSDHRLERGGRWQVHEVGLGFGRGAEVALTEQPDGRGDTASPPVVRPCLGNPVPSSTRMPVRAGIAARKRRHTSSALQSASVMKYCRA